MFIPLKQVISLTLKNKIFFNQINNIKTLEDIDKIIKGLLSKSTNHRFKIIKYKNKTIFIKTNSFLLSTELKLKEESIKKELRKDGILVESIKCGC